MSTTRRCPNCGAENPLANRFCEDCGMDMNKIPKTMPPRIKICPKCSRENPADNRYCEYCSMDMDNPPKPEPRPYAMPNPDPVSSAMHVLTNEDMKRKRRV